MRIGDRYELAMELMGRYARAGRAEGGRSWTASAWPPATTASTPSPCCAGAAGWWSTPTGAPSPPLRHEVPESAAGGLGGFRIHLLRAAAALPRRADPASGGTSAAGHRRRDTRAAVSGEPQHRGEDGRRAPQGSRRPAHGADQARQPAAPSDPRPAWLPERRGRPRLPGDRPRVAQR